jgi:5'-nucleotidase
MKILITNDDGIDAPGLTALYDIALGLTNAENILTVAPGTEQSGVGHAITYMGPVTLEKRAPRRWAAHGTPADCVIIGINEGDHRPDLVLSGVNRGNNAGQNTLYSGTVGATIEAAMNGIPGIALSQFYGPKLDGQDTFDAARMHGLKTVKDILDRGLWSNGSAPVHYNVNFPPCMGAEVKGTAFTTQGYRKGSPFGTQHIDGELRVKGNPQQRQDTGAGTDITANIKDLIAITPCSIDLTDQVILEQLRNS